ncbi:MAG: glycosyltransferase family 2 protein [Ruminococcus sp.]
MSKENSEKLVSIVLPIYNGEKYMRLSIDSILSQTYKNWELIIIDDCSTDKTPEIAKAYSDKDARISYYRNEVNLKLPRGLNRGFSLSKGDYLTWTSDDNLYLPEAIERMLNTLQKENTDFVFATCDVINENGEVVEIIKAPKNYKKAILGGNFVGACFMYTRKVYEAIGDYNPDNFLVEDYDYWLKIFAKFDVSNIQDVLYQYRWHDGALTSTEKKERINDVCERVLINNVREYGKLGFLQKYYFYSQLDRLRQCKSDKKEREKYRKKYKILRVGYMMFYYIPKRLIDMIFGQR